MKKQFSKQLLQQQGDSRTLDELEQRHQQAIAVAEKCTKILEEDFGAKKVIIFGSLRGDSPWHWHSDLDLAVQGISEEALWDAYGKIEQVVPPWLKFDLVCLDDLPSQVRTRILRENPMPKNKYLALKTRIEDEMLSIEQNIETLTKALAQAQNIDEIIIIPALASYLADFYTGCEYISERVAVELDGGLPKGENWHELLLRQVADKGVENRPALWSGSLLLELDEYRKFRHLVRHIYNVRLKPARVLKLAQNVQPVFKKIEEAIAVFNQWLENKAKSN